MDDGFLANITVNVAVTIFLGVILVINNERIICWNQSFWIWWAQRSQKAARRKLDNLSKALENFESIYQNDTTLVFILLQRLGYMLLLGIVAILMFVGFGLLALSLTLRGTTITTPEKALVSVVAVTAVAGIMAFPYYSSQFFQVTRPSDTKAGLEKRIAKLQRRLNEMEQT